MILFEMSLRLILLWGSWLTVESNINIVMLNACFLEYSSERLQVVVVIELGPVEVSNWQSHVFPKEY